MGVEVIDSHPSPRACGHHYSGGTSLGMAIAAVISWSANHSLLWVILHSFFGWFYVFAYALGMVTQ